MQLRASRMRTRKINCNKNSNHGTDPSLGPKEKAELAGRYLEERNYQWGQRNGQRISVHKTMRINPNQENKDREVFIGKLPRDLFEDELLPLMEKAGRVYRIRLMMDFSGTNRGFAFLEYVDESEALTARKLLNNSIIREGEPPIGVVQSFDNKKLFVGNLPVRVTAIRLRQELDKVVDGIENVHLPECSPKLNRRTAFVLFKTHQAAIQARRILCPGEIRICNRILSFDWAKPEAKTTNQSPVAATSTASINSLVDANNNSITGNINNNNHSSTCNRNHNRVANFNKASNLSNNITTGFGSISNTTNLSRGLSKGYIPSTPALGPQPTDPKANFSNLSRENMQPMLIDPQASPSAFSLSASSLASPSFPNILGEKTQQMLAACPPFNPFINYNQITEIL